MSTATTRVRRASFWFEPMALGRVAVLRLVAYVFVPLDMAWWTPWTRFHGQVPDLYRPLKVGKLLHLPTPTHAVVTILGILLVAACVLAIVDTLRGGRVRLLGAAVALLYAEWMVIAMSYGKVDHDRFAMLVLLAVLPTVGRARLREQTPSEAAGWALRCVQLAVVATYFLSAIAKFRFGGFDWVNGSTLVWAIIRRGTPLGKPLLHAPQLLHITQWGIVIMELCSPLLFVLRGRARTAYLWLLVAFHVTTFMAISILFLPHVICLLAFAPLERLPSLASVQALVRPRVRKPPPTPSPASPVSDPAVPAAPAYDR
jgi:hypothetical protein